MHTQPFAARPAQSLTGIHTVYQTWFKAALLLASLTLSPASHAEENPYSSHYQAQNQGNLHSMQAQPEPQIFSGVRREDDNIKMLESGFDLMGFSTFEAGEVDAALAVEHARTIQADSVLVYVKKAGGPSPSSKMEVIKEAVKKGQLLTEKDVANPSSSYRYYASFWAKLPAPLLGIHVIKLVQQKTDGADGKPQKGVATEGVRVIAVIHDSAAEKGGLQRGDQLLTIQQEKVNDAAQLSTLVRKYKGKAVMLKLEREGEPYTAEVQL